jgi:hypothetical protein
MGSGGIASLVNPSGVGATGAQTATNQYLSNQQKIKAASDFSQGLGHSTNVTQAEVSGPEAQFALSQGQNAISNTAAEDAFLNQQFGNLAGGLGKIIPGIANLGKTS